MGNEISQSVSCCRTEQNPLEDCCNVQDKQKVADAQGTFPRFSGRGERSAPNVLSPWHASTKAYTAVGEDVESDEESDVAGVLQLGEWAAEDGGGVRWAGRNSSQPPNRAHTTVAGGGGREWVPALSGLGQARDGEASLGGSLPDTPRSAEMRTVETPRSSVHTPRSTPDTPRSGGVTPRETSAAGTPRKLDADFTRNATVEAGPVDAGSWSGRGISQERERQKEMMIQKKVAILCKSCNGYSPYKAKECENCLKNLDKERRLLELSATKRQQAAQARKLSDRHRKFLEKQGKEETYAVMK